MFGGKKSRILAWVLAFAMLVSLTMPTALAADETYTDWSTSTSLPTSGTYRLTCDVTLSSQCQLTDDLTIDLNGHTITSTLSAGAFVVNSGMTLTINDTAGGGTITQTNTSGYSYAISVKVGGTLIVNGGTISRSSTSTSSSAVGYTIL
ncbi:MAG: hypothetical protein LUE61_03865, partial [Clostridiales bacterium]|nr:hypothetical protein [Clostridiales bacterium]